MPIKPPMPSEVGLNIDRDIRVSAFEPRGFCVPRLLLERSEGDLSNFVHRSSFRDPALLVIW
jgi:hypothetical protein